MRPLKNAVAGAVVAGAMATGYAYGDTPGDRNFGFNYSPDESHIIFYSYRGDARPDIWVRGPHGAEKNLTARTETWDIEPDFSPDGSKIIYASGPNMGMLSLRIMNANGSDDRIFYDGDDNEVAPNWSPDGSKVIFSAFNRNEDTNIIYITDANGGHARSLTGDLPGQSSNASWSVDGKWIVFSNKLGDDGQADIYKMRSDGSHRQRLTNDTLSQIAPVFTPDMKSIIFIGFAEDGRAELYSMPAGGLHHGTVPTRISHTNGDLKYFLKYTPDGQHLIFSEGDWSKGFELARLAAPR